MTVSLLRLSEGIHFATLESKYGQPNLGLTASRWLTILAHE